MNIDMQEILTGCSIIGITAALASIFSHISNSSKHPYKNEVVSQKVCDSEMKRINDCVEAKFEGLKEIVVRIENKLDKLNNLKGE